MNPQRLLDTPVLEITDPALIDLISELNEVTTVQPEERQSLHSFLTQCLYPAGAKERYKIDQHRLTLGRNLLKKVGKFQGTAIYTMCDELAQMKNQSAELVLNMSLYVFLNKYLPDFWKKPKKWRYDPRDWRG